MSDPAMTETDPIGYVPGYDVERYEGGDWTLYRTTKTDSVEVAQGKTTIGLLWSYWRHRLLQPIR